MNPDETSQAAQPPQEAVQRLRIIADHLGRYDPPGYPNEYVAALREIANCLAAQPVKCVCGSPLTLGTVHRTDGPCFVWERESGLDY